MEVEISDGARRAINKQAGKRGLATSEDVVDWVWDRIEDDVAELLFQTGATFRPDGSADPEDGT